MKATISRWQLAEAAQVVKGLVAKDGLSVFSRVRLDASGSLSVTGSNGDVQVEWQMVGWIGTQGTVTVPGAAFAAFVGALLNGKSAYDAAVLAADYTVRCIELTQGDPTHWYGVKFELALPEFIRMLEH